MNNDQLLKNLNQMLINMPGYVYWKNTHSQYMGCNLNLANLSGLNHPNDIVGKTDYDFYWGENQAQEFINDDKEIFKTGNIKTTVYKLPIKSGLYKYTYIKTDKLPVYDLNNNIVGVLGIALDITEEKHKDENFKKVVSQAVHDIRSPLSSILMISKFNKQIPENIRKAIKSACENINNISENILQKYNPETKEFDFEVESEKELFFPYLTIQEVTANKKFEYLNKNLDIDIEAKNLFFSINGNQGMFRRALSNIINNSIEAATMDPKILISVTSEPDGCHIKITDNGVGIPQEKIDEINNNIFSTSKKTGHGIGLKQVKETIEDMDGRMTINSTVGVGTSIDIVIPESEKLPKWSCNEIKIDLDDLVIILDDEKSMEIAWNNCLKDLNIQPIFFSNYNSLLNSLPEFSNKNIFLITDYELPNQGVSGIDIIDKISPNKKILITSHYNDKKVQEACIERGINIVPKTLLSDIPITVNLENKPAQTNNYITTANLILLDDDYLITDNLKNTFPNKKIVVFNNINLFNEEISKYSKDTLIFLDNSLDDNIYGIDIAKQLYKRGYNHIYIFSAKSFNKHELPPYLKYIDKFDLESIEQIINGNTYYDNTNEFSKNCTINNDSLFQDKMHDLMSPLTYTSLLAQKLIKKLNKESTSQEVKTLVKNMHNSLMFACNFTRLSDNKKFEAKNSPISAMYVSEFFNKLEKLIFTDKSTIVESINIQNDFQIAINEDYFIFALGYIINNNINLNQDFRLDDVSIVTTGSKNKIIFKEVILSNFIINYMQNFINSHYLTVKIEKLFHNNYFNLEFEFNIIK